MSKSPLRIALTPGAENGVGPELLVRALCAVNKGGKFYWCGDAASLTLACDRAGIGVHIQQQNAVLEDGTALAIFPAIDKTDMLQRQARFLDLSVELAKTNKIDAIVTGPIEKAALSYVAAGPFIGQTEYFSAHLGRGKTPFMAFLGGPFMLSLLTTHVPLCRIANIIHEDLILNHLQSVATLRGQMLRKPATEVKIILLGQNPHAGEGGLIGDAEQKIFIPAIKRAVALGLSVEGPLPADGFFGYYHHRTSQPDAVIASYHDQGLAPYKLLSQEGAVNITLGLTHLRVSPAHGTASDLAGRRSASALSTINALKLALDLARTFT